MSSEARYNHVKCGKMLVASQSVSHAVRHTGANDGARCSDTTIRRLIRDRGDGQSDVHQTKDAQVHQRREISEVPSLSTVLSVGSLLDLQTLVAGKIEVSQLVVPVPVPVVWPVGDVVLEHVTTNIKYRELLHFAELCRKDLELVAVDVQHLE